MTNQNPLLVALVLLTSLILCVTGQTNEPAPRAAKRSIGKQEQVAQDAIVITTTEVSYAKAFMNSILKLKSLAGDHEVIQCVGGSTDAMNNVVSELKKLQGSWPSLHWGTGSLENVVDEVLSYNVICARALGDVDATIKLMVLRKLQDVALLTNDVIFRVSKLHLDTKVTGKP